MIKKNEEYIVKIIDNGCQGEGIAKIEGIPIFIENAIKDEEIKIKILKVQKNFAYGKIIEILKESKSRKDSDCNTFSKCGGCSLRHMDYEKTLIIKENIVQNCLNKMVKENIKINNIIGMDEPFYYRNKLQYPVGFFNKQKVMGVYSMRTHNIIPTIECKIQNKLCQEVANYAFEFIKAKNIKAYDENFGKGTIRHIVVRVGIKTNEILLTLVLNDNQIKKIEDEFVDYMIEKFPEIKSIVKNYNSEKTNVILGKKCEVIYGPGYIYDVLGDYKFKISPLSFYQINPIQTEKLYSIAVNNAIENYSGKDIALDLYCGIGTIGIFASKYFKKVYGIEIIQEAIEDAKENAKINNIENTEFYAGDVEKILPQILDKEKIKPGVVFVDPPRKGLDKNTVQLLLNLEPQKIVYVSCNPATLARDLLLLEEKYSIKNVQPVDMFPYTHHVECCALLCKKENSQTIQQ